MLLKRQHDSAGSCTGVLVKHTGLTAEQNFSRRLVSQAVAAGWMEIDGDLLTIDAKPEPLRYQLLRTPGYYCLSSGDRIPIGENAWVELLAGEAALASRERAAWLASHGMQADDYTLTLAYECVLSAEQHVKFKAVRAPSGNVVAAHTLEG